MQTPSARLQRRHAPNKGCVTPTPYVEWLKHVQPCALTDEGRHNHSIWYSTYLFCIDGPEDGKSNLRSHTYQAYHPSPSPRPTSPPPPPRFTRIIGQLQRILDAGNSDPNAPRLVMCFLSGLVGPHDLSAAYSESQCYEVANAPPAIPPPCGF